MSKIKEVLVISFLFLMLSCSFVTAETEREGSGSLNAFKKETLRYGNFANVVSENDWVETASYFAKFSDPDLGWLGILSKDLNEACRDGRGRTYEDYDLNCAGSDSCEGTLTTTDCDGKSTTITTDDFRFGTVSQAGIGTFASIETTASLCEPYCQNKCGNDLVCLSNCFTLNRREVRTCARPSKKRITNYFEESCNSLFTESLPGGATLTTEFNFDGDYFATEIIDCEGKCNPLNGACERCKEKYCFPIPFGSGFGGRINIIESITNENFDFSCWKEFGDDWKAQLNVVTDGTERGTTYELCIGGKF